MKFLAIIIGKFAIFGTHLFGVGGGTTLPGLLAEMVDPNFIKKMAPKIKKGIVVVTGTNGKTTSAKMLSDILIEDGYSVINNSAGSNLSRGIASAFVASSNLFGTRLHADVAILEVDEATMPEVTTKLRPSIVLVTNLFRDQLDRYGELDKTAALIGGSLRGFPNMTTILNADDPLVSSLAEYVEGPVGYFGLEDENIKTDSRAAMDSKDCIFCGHELTYSNRYFGHLGAWRCDNCKKERAKTAASVSGIETTPVKSKFNLNLGKESLAVEMPLPGLYNVYNALAAASVAFSLGAGAPAISHALRNCESAFGRMEVLAVDGKKIMLTLIKNPTGANQALSAIYSDAKGKKIVFALNDNFADGTDISWIWDIDFEYFNPGDSLFIATGIRSGEVALRLKYAGVPTKNIIIEKDLAKAVRVLAGRLSDGEMGYLLPTYTAMMEIRSKFTGNSDELTNLGKVTKHGM